MGRVHGEPQSSTQTAPVNMKTFVFSVCVCLLVVLSNGAAFPSGPIPISYINGVERYNIPALETNLNTASIVAHSTGVALPGPAGLKAYPNGAVVPKEDAFNEAIKAYYNPALYN